MFCFGRDQALVAVLKGERFCQCRSIIVYCTRRDECQRLAAYIRTCLQVPRQSSVRIISRFGYGKSEAISKLGRKLMIESDLLIFKNQNQGQKRREVGSFITLYYIEIVIGNVFRFYQNPIIEFFYLILPINQTRSKFDTVYYFFSFTVCFLI